MAYEKYLLLERGARITIQDSSGNLVQFETIAEFNSCYDGTEEFSGEYYVCYKPNIPLLYKQAEDTYAALSNNWAGQVTAYETIISDVVDMRAKLDDPYNGLDLAAAKIQRKLI